jgi:hypothetical protein
MASDARLRICTAERPEVRKAELRNGSGCLERPYSGSSSLHSF